MLNRLLAAGALSALALASAAVAQDETAAPAATEAPASAPAADAPVAPRTYAPVDFDITHDPANILLLDLSNGRRVAIRLMPDWAPNHVERIKTLTRAGFYDGVKFHRVIPGFMAQGGDPTGTGMHGSDKPNLKAEFNKEPHVRGICSMARTNDPNTANSQFFIVFDDARFLDGQYTVWGQVTDGMELIDALPKGEPPRQPGKIVKARTE